MQGAREFARLFRTGQYGRLYLVSGEHARGRTFHIYVLPKDEEVVRNGLNNPPLNSKSVEVYGIVSGQPGWTESYGWIHHGQWKEDFAKLVKEASARQDAKELAEIADKIKFEEEKYRRELELLADY